MGKFFLWLAGVRSEALEPGPERQRYLMMGVSIVMASTLAAVAMWLTIGYVLVDASVAVRIGASLFWACLVAVIDRTIAVLIPAGGAVKRLLAYLPRLLFALIAAYLVSEAIVIAVYDKEVDRYIVTTAEDQRGELTVTATPNFTAPNDVVAGIEAEIIAIKASITNFDKLAEEERNGTGASGVPSCGRRCLEFTQQRVDAEGALREAESRLARAQADKAVAQADLDVQRDEFVDGQITADQNADGIAARRKALDGYLGSEPGANLVRWGIVAILLLADLAVVLFKLAGGPSGYELTEAHRLNRMRRRLADEELAAGRRSATDAEVTAAADAEMEARIAAMARDDQVRRARRRYERRASFDDRMHGRGGTDGAWSGDDDGADTPVYRDTPHYPDDAGTQDDWQPEPAEGVVIPGNAAGPYLLSKEIGRGSYGVVHLARDQGGGGREVAVKSMQAEDSASWDREVRSAARLGHPSIAPVLDTGKYGEDHLFVVYPYYPGGSLADARRAGRFRRRPRISLGYALQVFEKVVDALSLAHVHGIVHRDIKPGNILLDGDGNVRVSDWGRARSLADLSLSPALADGRWAAPEVFAAVGSERDPSDGRSDLYSAAAVLYWLITGAAPLVREITLEGLPKDESGRRQAERRQLVAERVDRCHPDIPEEVATLIAQWLDRDPAVRARGAAAADACKQARLQLVTAQARMSQDRLREIEVGGPWPS